MIELNIISTVVQRSLEGRPIPTGGNTIIVQGGGSVDVDAIVKEVKDAIRNDFLSSLNDDEAEGVIDFLNGLKVKGNLVDSVLLAANESTLTDTQLMTAAKIAKYVDDEIKKLDDRFLRKDQDDTAHGVITFENQIKSHDFAQGNLMGAGWSIYRDGNGNVVVETDRMIIRKDLSVSELIVNQETFQKGSTIYVKGGCTITRVEETETYYRCYFDNKDGEEFSGFVVGDQARCQRYDKSYQNVIKYYWRLVVGVGDDYVDLSKTDVDGTGLPTEGDDIAQLGNRTDKTRQSAVVISPDSGGSVVIWANINSFDLSEKNMIGMGVNPATGRAYLYGYGDMFFGDRTLKKNFITYQVKDGDTEPTMVVSADLEIGSGSTGLSNLSDFQALSTQVNGIQGSVTSINGEIEGIQSDVDKIKQQTDKEYTIWFGDYTPTATNKPASDWTTDALKEEHEEDLFYNTSVVAGEGGRGFRYLSGTWGEITDHDTLAALEQLAALQNRVSDFDSLKEAFKDDETLVSGGLVMASLLGVRNKENEVEAFLNGSDFAEDKTHGKLLLAGGIPSGSDLIEERAKAALTRIYEDGYLFTENMKAKGAILEAIHVLSAIIEGDLILGESHIMSIQSTDGAYPAIVWDTNLLKLGLEQINGNVSGLVQLGDLYGKNTSIRPNRIEVADTPVSADILNRNKVVVESGIIYIYNKNYSSPMTIKVSDEGKMNISDGTSSLDLSFSGGKPIIYSSAWPSQSDVPSGGVFMDGSGYLKIKG